MKYFGIGRDTVVISNHDTNYVWIQQQELDVSATCFRKIYKGLFGGFEFGYTIVDLQGTDSLSKAILSRSGLPLGRITQTELVPTLVWDNRDNIFWSSKGYYASLSLQYSNIFLINSPNYTILSGWVNGYHNLLRNNKRLSLAWHLYAQAGWGEFPYRTYAMYGSGDGATGYSVGKYVNKSEVTVQAELRYDLWKYIAFGYYIGTGKIFPSYSVFGQSAWLHFTGARLYINIISYRNIRLRFEVAKGRKDYGFYIGIGQAF
jgi:outer membrane protein assembly factor BamA